MNGAVIWEGPSLFDGTPIMLVLTGFPRGARSSNSKTGDLVQSWVLRRDMFPVEAVHNGADSAICGTCPLMGEGCYVRLDGPSQVFMGALGLMVTKGKRAGQVYKRYPRMSPEEAGLKCAGAPGVRFGSYGDPAMIPVAVWRALKEAAVRAGCRKFAGYTHRWNNLRGPEKMAWQGIVMASCVGTEEAARARADGWRAFVVTPSGAPMPAGLVMCPASTESKMARAARGNDLSVTCSTCGLCDGARRGDVRPSIGIHAHGTRKHKIVFGKEGA